MRDSRSIAIAILFAGVLIAGALYISMGGSFAFGKAAPQGNPSLVRPVDPADHILGNPAAKVLIVEYADFDCEFCKGFSDTLNQLIATDGASGQVAWVYREDPLTDLHKNALAHARAAECVAKVAGNDAFWRFADLLFANQPVDPSRYGALAEEAGVPDKQAFAICYADAANQVDARITADIKNAKDIGASGTPYSLIIVSGQVPIVLDGAYPYDALKQYIDQALGKTQ